MEKSRQIVRILFAIPWLVFGIQHFMYADFVATLVPSFMPLKLFWAYFTGVAMFAAGIAFIVNKLSSLAAMLLGLMLWGFILMIHVPALIIGPVTAASWTRPLQDISLACASLLLVTFLSNSESNNEINKPFFDWVIKISRYLFAIVLIGFGIQQFFDLDFVTAKVPLYFPFQSFWVYLSGIVMIAAGISVIINIKARPVLIALGLFLLIINLFNYIYLLANTLHDPVLWTGAMLNLAITAGVFILAETIPAKE